MESLSGLRVAIYARHSTHMQAGSAEDQIARCINLVEQMGGQVAEIYSDEARTGATTARRDGINRLMSDATAQRFEAVVFEDLSRLSRDIADIANMFRELMFAGVALHSVTEGRVSELHVGLKGTMNQLFLKDLGDKSRRGLRASVKRGRILNYPYGYEKSPTFDAAGKPVAGQARINPAEAAVIQRIYEEYAAGNPVAAIVRALNHEGIPAPNGRGWSKTSLYGSRARRDGILRRPLYVGEYVWGRFTHRKDPRTGKQTRQHVPKNEWEIRKVPHLAIVGRQLWTRVQERLEPHLPPRPAGRRKRTRPWHPPGPQHHVTSGISWCARCGGRLTAVRGGSLRCQRQLYQVTCDQPFQIPRQAVITKVLRVLRMRLTNHRHHLLDLIRHEHEQRLGDTATRAVECADIEAAITRRRSKLATLLDLIEDGTGGSETRRRVRQHEKSLRADIRNLEEIAAATPRVAEQSLAAVEGKARARILAAINHLLTVDKDDEQAIALIRTALARIDAAYRGPDRARLRANPTLDPAGVYDLGLGCHDNHQSASTAEAA